MPDNYFYDLALFTITESVFYVTLNFMSKARLNQQI
ncbi:hypothetical protein SHVI106290_11095 [Shewanella violacea]|uniref:Uncharacterized protein n=1 Tax=Shewanella violacea (strain JCM 10179 / CIP 106290 / LMG 19151 / DSS12) TaxID=637905 RepID=D4ZK43_SHEVD|nr:hypothetical protein SVI_2071 [Shewanella violacea DSS12]